VTVHPDGEERAATDSRVFTDSAMLEAVIPVDAIKGSMRGELKIYPNLVAHVFESIEGILERPYGCGEQTISSTYPSLLILSAYRRNNVEPPEKVDAKARRYLRDGYERLLNYRSESGGFSYWGGRADTDLALTAYALRFLHDAREFIEVDETVVTAAREWLIKEQRADGSWPAHLSNDSEKESGSTVVTALIARSLALEEKRGAKPEAPQPAPAQKSSHDALRLALDYLSRRVEETDEPYVIASYALASMDAGEKERAARAAARLRRLVHDDGDGSYWTLETNTPFYGWGQAGRIETTALVVQALARGATVERESAARKEGAAQGQAAMPADVKSEKETEEALTNRGLVFLLRQKDRYGVWYSTQATINVLDALIALLSVSADASDNTANTADVTVNGRRAGTIQLPPSNQLSGPLTLDISRFLSTGINRVMIERAGVRTQASAQVVSNYYLPWSKALTDETVSRSASKLKLAVNFDKTETGVMGEVTCKVRAERLGFSGYGMMLAEIGLPPGADVDRASLERAMKESDWSFNRYDLLPDRLVVYLWPRAGGTDFEFKLRPRLGLNAQTAPSVLYDYYNPEARVVLAPVRFLVR
jgi:CD109 antigen